MYTWRKSGAGHSIDGSAMNIKCVGSVSVEFSNKIIIVCQLSLRKSRKLIRGSVWVVWRGSFVIAFIYGSSKRVSWSMFIELLHLLKACLSLRFSDIQLWGVVVNNYFRIPPLHITHRKYCIQLWGVVVTLEYLRYAQEILCFFLWNLFLLCRRSPYLQIYGETENALEWRFYDLE